MRGAMGSCLELTAASRVHHGRGRANHIFVDFELVRAADNGEVREFAGMEELEKFRLAYSRHGCRGFVGGVEVDDLLGLKEDQRFLFSGMKFFELRRLAQQSAEKRHALGQQLRSHGRTSRFLPHLISSTRARANWIVHGHLKLCLNQNEVRPRPGPT